MSLDRLASQSATEPEPNIRVPSIEQGLLQHTTTDYSCTSVILNAYYLSEKQKSE